MVPEISVWLIFLCSGRYRLMYAHPEAAFVIPADPYFNIIILRLWSGSRIPKLRTFVLQVVKVPAWEDDKLSWNLGADTAGADLDLAASIGSPVKIVGSRPNSPTSARLCRVSIRSTGRWGNPGCAGNHFDRAELDTCCGPAISPGLEFCDT